jgi:hypothetical protein
MVSHDPETIARKVLVSMQSDGQRTRPVALGVIDADKLFLPPEYTQLFYSPLWHDLDRHHQLRYVQLYALRTNEVIMLFERYLVQAILPPMARRLEALQLPALRQLLLEMLHEEEEHDAAFVALNRASRPDLYQETDFFFFPPSAEVRSFIAVMGFSARWLAHPLWLLFFIEESSLALARGLAAIGETHDLGAVEPNWLAVHQEHTRDERRHTLVDRLLFENCYANRGDRARRLDGWIFERILKAIMYPRAHGAGMQVVEQLIRDCPELSRMRPAMVREIVALGHNPDFLASLLSQRLAPRAWKLFHRCPELNTLASWIPNYA